MTDDTRQNILAAAEALFLSHGYHGSSMRQIAKQAGYSAVSGLYNHFGNKEALFEALIQDRNPYQDVLAVLAEVEGQDGPDLLRNAFAALQAVFVDYQTFLKLLLIDLNEFEGRFVRAIWGEVMPEVLRFAQRVRQAGGIRQDVALPLMLQAFGGLLISSMVANAVASGLLGQAAPSDETVIDVLIEGLAVD
ncbi:MAG: TetR/AcrR family transcriptional regulator [Chloroflexi bacterium]|nr:TetR/AcrR family transcriptional regulator [Chloroflexota bacterium]